MKVDSVMPREAAALLLTWLQTHGAVVEINTDGELRVDLNPVRGITDWNTADRIATAVLSLREEIKGLLRAAQIVH